MMMRGDCTGNIDSAIWLKNYVDLEEMTETKSVYRFDEITQPKKLIAILGNN